MWGSGRESRISTGEAKTCMLVDDPYFYTKVRSEFYERMDYYEPNSADFHNVVQMLLPEGSQIVRRGIWFVCTLPNSSFPSQGWKIHVSATLANAAEILATATRFLGKARISFKFALDKNIFLLLNGKRWPRGNAGKFITIYPRDIEQFRKILDELYGMLVGYNGPYILSDRRYRDCNVLYYRYGGFTREDSLRVTGDSVSVLNAAAGKVADERLPYFAIPEGVDEPFPAEPRSSDQDVSGTLRNGRYIMESALAFSNSGGVYLGTDRETQTKVVIKEARPYTNLSRGAEAVSLLKKEHRLLMLLEEERLAPRPIEFFKDWEHYYLVEEYLEDAQPLRGYAVEHALALRTRPRPEEFEEFFLWFRELYAKIASVLQRFHRRNIVFSDISLYNVMVLQDGKDVKFIDFEGAYERGVDAPTFMFTPGFMPTDAIARGFAQCEDDYYGLGCLMFAGLFPLNSFMAVDPGAYKRFLEAWKQDLRLPGEILRLILASMDPDPSRRPTPTQVIEVLEADCPISQPEQQPAIEEAEDWRGFLWRITGYLESVASYDREDRLFPADPAIFETNPLSIAHGACGVACALKRTTGDVPQKVMDWILSRSFRTTEYPPGLYLGLSGIAWALLELGQRDRAIEVIRSTHTHPLLWDSPDLFYGAAGWGMAQLRFFGETDDQSFLSQASKAGRFLVDHREESEEGCWWPCLGDTCAGLAHGASGVSLFLLYLHLATGKEEFLTIGRKGIDFVLGRAIQNGSGGISWRAKETEPTFTPYWRWGSAGVGMVLLRYQRVLDDSRLGTALEDLLLDTDRKYTIFPGNFFGLSGIGDFLLDMAMFQKDGSRLMDMAWKVMSGIKLFAVEREGGIAFPGDALMRISCDYGTGGAGVAMFLHRLLTKEGPAFMLDQLLPSRTVNTDLIYVAES
jgi:serine/threonine protein kinase